VKHIGLACSELPLTLAERIGHIVLGIFELIPILGHLIAAIDYALNGRMKVIILDSSDPFLRGQQLGRELKDDIQLIYSLVLGEINRNRTNSFQTQNFERKVEQLQEHLSDDLMLEMQRLSEGAEVELHDVFAVHAFIDIFAGRYGCSALASVINDSRVDRISTTNHFTGDLCFFSMGSQESINRKNELDQHDLDVSIRSHQTALTKVSREDTIQSVVFDINSKEIHLAAAWGYSSNTSWKALSSSEVFPNHPVISNPALGNVKLARTLDWPWLFLAPYTTVVVTNPGEGKKSFANVTFPGFLGVLTGMNEDRVALAACQAGSSTQNGQLITLLFRDVLENAGTCEEALNIIQNTTPASSMNLTIAAPDRIASIEIDPARAQMGWASIRTSD
jgi:hypothetical protein